jgi:hypothetical protein
LTDEDAMEARDFSGGLADRIERGLRQRGTSPRQRNEESNSETQPYFLRTYFCSLRGPTSAP